jgi:hypothetical protein
MKTDAYVCCDDWQCGCGGKTWGEKWAELAKGPEDSPYRPLIWSRIEARQVSLWQPSESVS